MAMLLKLAPGLFRVHVHPHLLRLFFRFPCSSSSESRCGANYGIATPRALLFCEFSDWRLQTGG